MSTPKNTDSPTTSESPQEPTPITPKYNILMATHAPNNICSVEFTTSLIMTQRYLDSKGISNNVNFIVNGISFNESRNIAVANLLKNPNYTHILFINKDVVWRPQFIELLLSHDKNVIGGVCPRGNMKWDNIVRPKVFNKIRDFRSALSDKSTQKEIQTALSLLVSFVKANTMIYNIQLSDNLSISNAQLEASFLSTDFMLVKRSVFEKMVDRYNFTKYTDNVNCSEEENKFLYGFFQSQIEEGTFLSGDQIFCKRWQKMDGKILADIRIPLTRSVPFKFNGNFFHSLDKIVEPTPPQKEPVTIPEIITDKLPKELTVTTTPPVLCTPVLCTLSGEKSTSSTDID